MRSLDCRPHALRGPSSIAHCSSGPEVHSASLEGRNGASRISHSRVSGLLASTLPWLLLSLKVCGQWTDASGIGIFHKSNSHLPGLHVIQFPRESMCVNARKSLLCKRPLPTPAPAPLHHRPQCSHPQACLYRELHSFAPHSHLPLLPCLRSETAAPRRTRSSRHAKERELVHRDRLIRFSSSFCLCDIKGVHRCAQQGHFLRLY